MFEGQSIATIRNTGEPTSPDDERTRHLKEFGLTGAPARAYLALLSLGTSEARAVANLAKIPHAKVHQTLARLEERGLVRVVPSSPRRYAPVAFSEYLERMANEQRERLREMESRREELGELLSVEGDLDVDDRRYMEMARGRRVALESLIAGFDSATEDILAVGSDGSAQRAGRYERALTAARERGVRIRLLLPRTAGSPEAAATASRLAETRFFDPPEGAGRQASMALFDRKRALIIHYIPDDASPYEGRDVALSTESEAIARALHAVLEAAWEAATAIEPIPGTTP